VPQHPSSPRFKKKNNFPRGAEKRSAGRKENNGNGSKRRISAREKEVKKEGGVFPWGGEGREGRSQGERIFIEGASQKKKGDSERGGGVDEGGAQAMSRR